MKPEWLPASEAAKLLEARGVEPIEALASIIRQTGEHGLNIYWGLANRITIRGRSGTQWLSAPEIELPAGTILVPTYASGRRLPEMVAMPLLITKSELDRRWPGSNQPARGGRPLNYDREAFEEALRLEIIARGFPSSENEKGWRTKADVQRWTEDFLADRQETLGDTQVKKLVSDALEKLAKKRSETRSRPFPTNSG